MEGTKTQNNTAARSHSHSELSTLINKTLNTKQIDYLTGSNTEISQKRALN